MMKFGFVHIDKITLFSYNDISKIHNLYLFENIRGNNRAKRYCKGC